MTLHLTLSLAGSGYHPAAWHLSSLSHAPNAASFQSLVRAAEHACIDAILLGIPVEGDIDRTNTMQLDPLPLLGSLIAGTRRIGLAASWTVDFTEPFHVARVFATLDHLSYGRTAWIARMFDAESLLPLIGKPPETDGVAAYCARAGEFIDVVRKLWDSWEDEAFALDKASGMFADPNRVHPINHASRYFNVRGPMNVPRPPQGNPVLVMRNPPAPAARAFVASVAEVILIDAPSRAHCEELRQFADGREIKVLADLLCILGDTEDAARRRAETLDAMAAPTYGCARFVGTPMQLVGLLADCQRQKSCDGFNILPAVLPDDVDLLVGSVAPIARQRGLVRTDYSGTTMREHLALPRPRSRYAERASP
jgi:alkanesulfonate monooxygenase SsuD/methylene tetrahydromethanopterin reductase-like flavin-dependent oxidoreductase (luciferase family)